MNTNEARWVRDHVWTDAMRADNEKYPMYLTTCPCKPAECWECAHGHHEKCFNVTIPVGRHEEDVPAAYLHDGRPGCGPLEQVWEVGVVHDARCSCLKANHHGHREHHQTDLFETLGMTL